MLYERWRHISSERPSALALRDCSSGRRWTFAELFAVGESRSAAESPLVFTQGQCPEFILDVLAAWRENKVLCPLDPGQIPPASQTDRIGCHLKSTSATGGAARWIVFREDQLAADADNIVATMGLRFDWPNLGVISLAHSYGFSNLVLPLLLHGIPLILVAAPLPEMIRQAAQTEEAVTLPAVPAMWRAWLQADAIPPQTRLAISAGAPLPLSLEKSVFDHCKLKIHNFLGSSECGGMAYDASELPRTDASCVGTPMRNVNLSLNTEGCLRVCSRAVGETYWPEKSDALNEGVFQTTDLAEINDGQVFLRGRLGDQINAAGRKISPEAIEQALLTHPHVRECLVFGAPSRDAERTEIIVAVVVADAKEAELKHFLLERMPAWQVPREWCFMDSLPINARGKLSRADWRQRWNP